MKTSIDITDSLFKRLRELAQARKTSIRRLIEEGARMLLEESEKRPPVKPKLLTFGGDGLTERFSDGRLDWDKIREEVYGDSC